MSYEASAHKVQMKILNYLLHMPSAGYADIQKQTDLSSDHFNFHIKKLIESGYVQKKSDGSYALSRLGKEYANRMDTDDNTIERQPKISVALIIERQIDGRREFLFQQRLKNPYYGFWGRMGGKVRWGETFEEAASRELMEETGLSGEFQFKMIYNKRDFDKVSKDLLEAKIFIIMHTDMFKGELQEQYEGGINRWMTQEKFLHQEKRFESAHEFVELIDKGVTYHQKDFYYSEEEY